jgi:hypothetical protein
MSNTYINPVKACSTEYGFENVKEVSECIMASIRRFYGPLCSFHQAGLYKSIQEYMVQILIQDGRNPNAIKLPLPIGPIQHGFFVKRYIESFDKNKAYELAINDCRVLKRPIEDYINCKIDRDSVYYK